MVKHMQDQKGFTLVELAVVMIIIGLLLAGILKGQEMIANARVSATVAQVKGIDAATTTFRDMFNSFPGDILASRLPNCLGQCNVDGNNNGIVGAVTTFNAAPLTEQISFFSQLAAADLIGGIDPNAGAASWGGWYPAAELSGGGFHVGFASGGAALTNQQPGTAAAVRRGHYLALHDTAGGGVNDTGFIIPQQAFRIDNKLDDGNPDAGSVLGAGSGSCAAAGPPPVYQEDQQGAECHIYVRFQQ